MEAGLPPGFRFYPTEEEIISFYLHNKLQGRRPDDIDAVIPVVDIYDHKPWDLPRYAGAICRGDPEQWFYFIPMQDREARGGRPNRLTNEGYWKATGSPGYVYSSENRVIGMKRTMVFYKGRAPNGEKTQWKMNEYKAIIDGEEASSSSPPKLRQEMSLCRVYIGSKSLRAFDRRPPPPPPGEPSSSYQPADHDHQLKREAQPPPPTTSSTSYDQTSNWPAGSGGEDDFPAAASSSSCWQGMEIDDEDQLSHHDDLAFNQEDPMWDWEQLNYWF